MLLIHFLATFVHQAEHHQSAAEIRAVLKGRDVIDPKPVAQFITSNVTVSSSCTKTK